jgi:hypothetical protein
MSKTAQLAHLGGETIDYTVELEQENAKLKLVLKDIAAGNF